MPMLRVFNSVSLDGYFSGEGGDLSWAHRDRKDAEWDAFVTGNAARGGALLFGRVTYEMMAGFWPTAAARGMDPAVAERMNALPKYVASRSLTHAAWSNSTVIGGELVAEVRRLKMEAGKDITILGSGSVVSQLAREGVVDEFQVVLLPVVLGKGRSMFEGVPRAGVKLVETRAFGNGNVLLRYQPLGGDR